MTDDYEEPEENRQSLLRKVIDFFKLSWMMLCGLRVAEIVRSPWRKSARAHGTARRIRPTKQRRSRKAALSFKQSIDEVFAEFLTKINHASNSSAKKFLFNLPPVNTLYCKQFSQRVWTHLGDEQVIPDPEYYKVEAIDRVTQCFLANFSEDPATAGDGFVSSDSWYIAKVRSVGLRALQRRPVLAGVRPTAWQLRTGKYVPAHRDPLAAIKYVYASECIMSRNTKLSHGDHIGLSMDGERWAMLCGDGHLEANEEYGRLLTMATAMQWQDDFFWRVLVRRERLTFAMSLRAVQVRELLWLRDVALGRREALRHIVSLHERRLKSGRTTTVRPHLRGAQECVWDDWHITVIPSRHDNAALAQRLNPDGNILKWLDHNLEVRTSVNDDRELQQVAQSGG